MRRHGWTAGLVLCALAARAAADDPPAPPAPPPAPPAAPQGDAPLGTGALVLHDREVFAVEGFDADRRAKVTAALTAMPVAHVE